ncbi:hypothetical protein [Streptomyces youssoufiensis]
MLDLRLTNGTFHTMDRSRPRARSLGIWRGRIVGVDEAVADLPAAHTLLTRNDLPCRDFTALAKAIDGDPLLSGEDGQSGALLLVDDTPYNEVVQYLVHGSSVELAQEAERRLRNLPR